MTCCWTSERLIHLSQNLRLHTEILSVPTHPTARKPSGRPNHGSPASAEKPTHSPSECRNVEWITRQKKLKVWLSEKIMQEKVTEPLFVWMNEEPKWLHIFTRTRIAEINQNTLRLSKQCQIRKNWGCRPFRPWKRQEQAPDWSTCRRPSRWANTQTREVTLTTCHNYRMLIGEEAQGHNQLAICGEHRRKRRKCGGSSGILFSTDTG